MIFIQHAGRASAKINSLDVSALIVPDLFNESVHIFFPSVFLTDSDHKGTEQAFAAAKWNVDI
jgi:hypothetical protein